MNSENSIPSTQPSRFRKLIWLPFVIIGLLCTLITAGLFIGCRLDADKWHSVFKTSAGMFSCMLIIIIAIGFLIGCLVAGMRRALSLRIILLGLAALITFIALYYTEENWRGKRAWENCKRELRTQGMDLDWRTFIP